MDRLDEIRQQCAEAKDDCAKGYMIHTADVEYLLSEVDRLNALHKREIIITGEYAQRVIDLTARAELANDPLTLEELREMEEEDNGKRRTD